MHGFHLITSLFLLHLTPEITLGAADAEFTAYTKTLFLNFIRSFLILALYTREQVDRMSSGGFRSNHVERQPVLLAALDNWLTSEPLQLFLRIWYFKADVKMETAGTNDGSPCFAV